MEYKPDIIQHCVALSQRVTKFSVKQCVLPRHWLTKLVGWLNNLINIWLDLSVSIKASQQVKEALQKDLQRSFILELHTRGM